jgi:tRNA-modifying protein YgfZ
MGFTMLTSLRDLQLATGATLSPEGVPLTFGQDEVARHGLEAGGVALYDRTHWGRIQVSNSDRLRFLHNQSTNDFNALRPGQGCETVFVNSTARTIDLVTAYALDDSVILLTSPGCNQTLMQWMDRFIFFADKVTLKDITQTTAAFTILGSNSEAFLDDLLQSVGYDLTNGNLSASGISGKVGHHCQVTLNGMEVRIAFGSGLASPGYTLMIAIENAADLWKLLIERGAIAFGETLWEQLRVQQGRPVPGKELTEDYNPLEAGLWRTISLSKGCYIGQETIARLHTYRGVKQQLWGVNLSEAVEPGSVVMAGDQKIGTLTSCVASATGYLGLVYVRTKVLEEQLGAGSEDGKVKVTIGQAAGDLVALPFVSHEYI